MDINKILPADFDGVFRFTNATDEDFKAKWGGVEYTYPAQKTSPMIIPSATPEEVQTIRKKFAKELAEREFYRSDRFKKFNNSHLDNAGQPTGGNPTPYTERDLSGFIQSCLEPLPIAQAQAKVVPKDDIESRLKTDEDGNKVTRALKKNDSLLKNQGEVVE